MGREIKRVPLDFGFPLNDSYADHCYRKHRETCSDDDCEHDIDREPPKGDGWQLWQTVSDGPITPVFATAEELIDWMCQPVPREKRPHYAPEAFPDNPAGQGWRREIAEPFVKEHGWAPTLLSTPDGRLIPGAEAVVLMGSKR